METREVTLGADGNPTPVVQIPNNSFATKAHVVGAVIGLIGGFLYARKKGKSTQKQIIYAVVASAAGYAIGKMIVKAQPVKIKK